MAVTSGSQTRVDRSLQARKLPPVERAALETTIRARAFDKYRECLANLSNEYNHHSTTILPGYMKSALSTSPPRPDVFTKSGGYFKMTPGEGRQDLSDAQVGQLGNKVCRVLDNLSITDPDFGKYAGVLGRMDVYQKKGSQDFIVVLVVSGKYASVEQAKQQSESRERINAQQQSQIFVVSASPAVDHDAIRTANFLSSIGYSNIILSTGDSHPQKKHTPYAKQKIADLEGQVSQLQKQLASKESDLKHSEKTIIKIAADRDEYCGQRNVANTVLREQRETIVTALSTLQSASFGSRAKAIGDAIGLLLPLVGKKD